MKHHTKLGLAGLLSAVVLCAAACGGAGGDNGMEDMGGMESSQAEQGFGGSSFDRRFIDEMVPHHRSAVEMAEVALNNAEHREIRDLARDIVSTQEAEIEELRDIKREEFGTSKVSMKMDMGQMEDMGMMMDPGELANREPFDRAFIDAMIPHHESAVEMAEVARQKSDNPRIEALAEEIAGAQEREILQMQDWRDEWYPQG